MDEQLEMFRRLTEAPGAPGHEQAVSSLMKEYLTPYAESFFSDGLGSLIAQHTGDPQGPKVMIAGHMDEVAFMVTRITDQGFLRIQPLGGWWSQVMLSQRVIVQTRDGMVEGVIGSKPPHLLKGDARKKALDIKDMYVDVGASSKEEAVSFGIRPGDTVIPVSPFTVMKNPKLLLGKAWDNRFGIAAAIDVMKRLAKEGHPNILYSVGTVQEEVGLRGAQTAVQTVIPDIAFALDVGIDAGTPGITEDEATTYLGKGPSIGIYDATMVPHKGLRDFVFQVANECNLPFQYETIPGGGTDAGRFHLAGKGIPSLNITVPARYIHSHVSIIHRDDYDTAIELLVQVIQRLDHSTVEKLRTY